MSYYNEDHDCAGVLSVPVAVVVSARSVSCDRTMLYPSTPASSRSEFVIAPVGFSHETSCLEISGGNMKCHSWRQVSGLSDSGHP